MIGPAFTKLATATTMAGLDTAVTLWFRLPILMAQPDAKSTVEWYRAVSEKTLALHHGTVDATMAGHRALLAMATGRAAPDHLAHAAVEMATAATRPAYRAVKANARRLSRAKQG
jgi:hypothetical protein